MDKDQEKISLDRFVAELIGNERELATAWIHIPNTPDCQPEVVRVYLQYDRKDLISISDQIESLRQELGCNYDYLQQQLQQRLPKSD